MGVLPGIAALLLAAGPVAEREAGLPEWLLGTWCPRAMFRTGPIAFELSPDQRLVPKPDDSPIDATYFGPGPHCMTWTASPGELSGRQTRGYFGRNDSAELTTISIAKGRLRFQRWEMFDLRSTPVRTGRYRLKSQRPNAIQFERVGRGSPYRIGYWREGDILKLETVWKRGDPAEAFPMMRSKG